MRTFAVGLMLLGLVGCGAQTGAAVTANKAPAETKEEKIFKRVADHLTHRIELEADLVLITMEESRLSDAADRLEKELDSLPDCRDNDNLYLASAYFRNVVEQFRTAGKQVKLSQDFKQLGDPVKADECMEHATNGIKSAKDTNAKIPELISTDTPPSTH